MCKLLKRNHGELNDHYLCLIVPRSDTCKYTSGVLPFSTDYPNQIGFEPFTELFGRPLESLSEPKIGDSMKLFCVDRGKTAANEIEILSMKIRLI